MSKRTQFRFFRPGAGTSKADDAGTKQDKAGLLQRSKSTDSVEMRAIHVHASEGDKCVAPVRSKPKRRQTVRDVSEHDTLSTDSIHWSDDVYAVEQVAQQFAGQFPVLAKVTQGGLNGIAVDCSPGQVYLVQNSGCQKRLLAQFINGNSTGANVNLPLDCCMDVCLKGSDELMKLSKLVEMSKLPIDVRVITVEKTADDVQSSADLTGRQLRLNSVGETVFLRANAISDGWINQTKVVVIPDLVNMKLSVACGMYGSTQQEWLDFLSMFDRAVRHLQFDTIEGYNGILTDEASSPGQQRQNPYENITLSSLRTSPAELSRDLAELTVLSNPNTNTIESGHLDTELVTGHRTAIYVNGVIPTGSGPSLKSELEATDEGYYTKHSTLNDLPAELTELTTAASNDDVTAQTDDTADTSPVNRWLKATKLPETPAKKIKPSDVRKLSPATPQKTALVKPPGVSPNTNKQLQPLNVPQKTAKPTVPLPFAKKKKVPTATLR